MTQDDRPEDVAALRAFNRVYTNRLGLLNPHLDGSPFTLSEARILYELAHRSAPTAAEIARALHLDRGQISRTLKRFSDRELVEMREDPAHGRQQLLSLTATGRASFDALEGKTQQALSELLTGLPAFRRNASLQLQKRFQQSSRPRRSRPLACAGSSQATLGGSSGGRRYFMRRNMAGTRTMKLWRPGSSLIPPIIRSRPRRCLGCGDGRSNGRFDLSG